jgi:hypothetical protein
MAPPTSPGVLAFPGRAYRACADTERVVSDQDDWEFADADDARAEIRAAVRYLLRGAAGSDRGDIVREIIEMVGAVARGLPPGGKDDPLDDGMPGG